VLLNRPWADVVAAPDLLVGTHCPAAELSQGVLSLHVGDLPSPLEAVPSEISADDLGECREPFPEHLAARDDLAVVGLEVLMSLHRILVAEWEKDCDVGHTAAGIWRHWARSRGFEEVVHVASSSVGGYRKTSAINLFIPEFLCSSKVAVDIGLIFL